MSKQTRMSESAHDFGRHMTPGFTDAALAASRQVWLAGLGASSLARQWARHQARRTFSAWVKQGSSVEARVMRVAGSRANASLATATALLYLGRRVAVATASVLTDKVTKALPAFKSATPARRGVANRSRVRARSTKSHASRPTSKTAKRTK